MIKAATLGLCLLLACLVAVPCHARTLTGLPRQKKILVTGRPVTVRYLLYLPDGYRREGKKKWPLILFLHGSTEKGDDVEKVRRRGLPACLEQSRSFPFLVISPQLPESQERWDPVEMKALLDAVLTDLRVDRDRMYLTGWSLGANGVWRMAARYPHLFAAIAPIAGWGDVDSARALRNLPVWAFHGARDTNVLPEESVAMVKALRREGGRVRFTLYPDLDHDCWGTVYRNEELYEWFLRHSRARKRTDLRHPAVKVQQAGKLRPAGGPQPAGLRSP
jgi:predicted peptidase